MKYISSTIIEFERPDIEHVPAELLRRQGTLLRAFYYEHYDSFVRGGKYIVQYIYYTVKKMRNLTRLQLDKQYSSLSQQAESLAPAESAVRSDDRDVVAYAYGTPADDSRLSDWLTAHHLPQPLARFADTPDTDAGKRLDELKKAAFYAFRKNALLVVESMDGLIANPLFYTVLDEYQMPVCSPDFPWLSRKNLKLMQAMALYQQNNATGK